MQYIPLCTHARTHTHISLLPLTSQPYMVITLCLYWCYFLNKGGITDLMQTDCLEFTCELWWFDDIHYTVLIKWMIFTISMLLVFNVCTDLVMPVPSIICCQKVIWFDPWVSHAFPFKVRMWWRVMTWTPIKSSRLVACFCLKSVDVSGQHLFYCSSGSYTSW